MQTITVTNASNHKIELEQADKYLIEIVDPGVEVEIASVFNLKDKDHQELKVVIHHKAAHTRANTIFRGVVDDQAYLKMMGRIIIDPNCPDTNSFLDERILLLSNNARAEAIPDLEIESDDVKCSHAAAITNINQEHLFYLTSRGVSEKKAKELIVEGFLKISSK